MGCLDVCFESDKVILHIWNQIISCVIKRLLTIAFGWFCHLKLHKSDNQIFESLKLIPLFKILLDKMKRQCCCEKSEYIVWIKLKVSNCIQDRLNRYPLLLDHSQWWRKLTEIDVSRQRHVSFFTQLTETDKPLPTVIRHFHFSGTHN